MLASFFILVPTALSQDALDDTAPTLPSEGAPEFTPQPQDTQPEMQPPSDRGARGPIRSERFDTGSNTVEQRPFSDWQKQPNLTERTWYLDLNNPEAQMNRDRGG